MNTPLHDQVRQQLAEYLDNSRSLRDFHAWLVSHTWNLHQIGDPEAEELTHEIETLFAEHSNGDFTDDELRAYLRDLSTPATNTTFQDAHNLLFIARTSELTLTLAGHRGSVTSASRPAVHTAGSLSVVPH